MDTTEDNPAQQPSSDPQQPDQAPIGSAPGVVMLSVPDWFREKARAREAFTPADKERLSEWFARFPIQQQLAAQARDRQAVFEALPDWAYDRLQRDANISPAENEQLDAYFQQNYPELAAHVNVRSVLGNWRYLNWYARNHGHPAPTLPPRPGRDAGQDRQSEGGSGTQATGD